jgi:uncharacterized membrane protein
MSKIIPAYAKGYWEPGKNPSAGIGLVAKKIYETIVNTYPNQEIIYCDFSDYSKFRGMNDVERFFSQNQTISKFIAAPKPQTATWISVNESALFSTSSAIRIVQFCLDY